MSPKFEPAFLDDLRHWIATNQRLATRLADLLAAIRRDPIHGIGKPESLRHGHPNTWSRRLTDEHRVVYRMEQSRLVFQSTRGHYTD